MRKLGNSAPSMTRVKPRFSFHRFFISVGSASPTSKVQHRLKFFAFKSCPNCIGRSRNSCTERPERQLHSWIAMFTLNNKAILASQSARTHLSPLSPGDQTPTLLTFTFMPVQSTEMSIPCKKNSIFFWYGTHRRARTISHALTECLNKREKCSTSKHRR